MPSVISRVAYSVFALTVFLGLVASAQSQLMARVQTPGGHPPVAREYVRIDGAGNYKTDDNGEFNFYLLGNLKVGHPATFHVDHNNSAIKVKSWVVISPCDLKNGRKDSLPDVGSEPFTIVVLPWGDTRLNAQSSRGYLIGCIIEELASQFRPAAARSGRASDSLWHESLPLQPQQVETRAGGAIKSQGAGVDLTRLAKVSFQARPPQVRSSQTHSDTVHQEWSEFLAEKAEEVGLPAAALAESIRAWNKAATGSYQKGLAALYEERYAEATRYITASLKSAGGSELKRYVPLARAEYEQAHYSAAENALRKVLAVHSDDPLIMNSLAIVLLAEARYQESEALLQRALPLAKLQDPEEIPSYLNNLGQVYFLEGRYDEAMKLYLEALALDKEANKPVSLGFSIRLNNIAELHAVQGKYGEAESELKQALKIEIDIMGPQKRNESLFLNNLGQVYYSEGKTEDAAQYSLDALTIDEKALGRQHPSVAVDLNNLALAYTQLKRNQEAENLFQRALAIDESILGPKHPTVAVILNNLAALYHLEGKQDEAETRFERALAIGKESLGPDHPDVARTLNNLAVTYTSEGKYAEAAALLQSAIQTKEKVLGPEDPQVAKSLLNLARLYALQQKYTDELPLLRRAFAIDEKASDPFVDEILYDLRAVLRLRGLDAEAKDYEERAARIRAKGNH